MKQLKIAGVEEIPGTEMNPRVLVCGGRDYDNHRLLGFVLDKLYVHRSGIACIIEGGQSGADALAKEWAIQRGVPWSEFKANWTLYGNAAGPMRNRRMLDEGLPDLVVAFPGNKGTSNMVRQAERRGVPVFRPFG